MKNLALALALIASPAFAQGSPGEAALAAPASEDHVALAQQTVDHLWPLGTYERMMEGTVDEIMDSVMDSMFNLRMADLAPAAPSEGSKSLDPEGAHATLGEAMHKVDPHFEERLRITNEVIMDEMVPVMARLEPRIREGLVQVCAREFTSSQLRGMNDFFATPAGQAYAAKSMLLYTSPEVVTAMMAATPEMIKEMPRILQKVQAATAHLPPPPETKEANGDDTTD